MVKRVLALFLLLFVLIIPRTALASGGNVQANSYSTSFLDNIIHSLSDNILGTYDQQRSLTQPGAISFFAQGIDTMITFRPASSLDFANYLSQNLHFPGTPKVTYAASGGIGYNSLQPVLRLWTVMRDIAYLFFAAAFVISGLMIMLRIKIDPKTVVTIQSALPKVVFALVLVTFSYAIAGFLVDIMYVVIGVVLGIFKNFLPDLPEKVANRSIFALWLSREGIGNALFGGRAVLEITSEFLKGALTPAAGTLAGIVTGTIAALIIAIAILWALFKTWLMLLSAYGNTLLLIIFSPVILMLDAIPGMNLFDGWLKSLLAFLLSFPAVIVMIAVGTLLSAEGFVQLSQGVDQGFVPPLLGGNSQAAMQSLVGIAILLTIPKTLEMIQAYIKAPKNEFGNAWGEAMGAAVGVARAGTNKAYQITGIPQAKEAWYKQRGTDAIAAGSRSVAGWIARNTPF